MQLLNELLTWTERYCAGEVEQPQFLAFLTQLQGSVTSAKAALDQLSFPDGYGEGAVFLQYSRQGLTTVGKSVEKLKSACLSDDGQGAENALQQAREAMEELQQVVNAAQEEKGSRGDGSFIAG